MAPRFQHPEKASRFLAQLAYVEDSTNMLLLVVALVLGLVIVDVRDLRSRQS